MLSPYRVLDLTNERGLLCGQILADLGADVIAVEAPEGNSARHLGPFAGDEPGPEQSLYWWAYSRNKRSVTLDIATERGREQLLQLAHDAHFLIESEPVGRMAELGLAYKDVAAVNPALVYVSISAFGQTGPKAKYAESDLIVGAAGSLEIGDADRAPLRFSVPQAYLHAGAEAAGAALIAHHERQRSGRGQHVDVSAQQAIAQTQQSGILAASVGDKNELKRVTGGAMFGGITLPLVWPAADGHVSLLFLFGNAIGPFSRRLMEWLHEEGHCDEATRDKDWIGYVALLGSGAEPVDEYMRVLGLIRDFIRTKTKAELMAEALKRRLLIVPMATIDELAASEQFAARDYWRDLEHPGPARYPGPFAKFGETPIEYRRGAPAIGQHNTDVLGDARQLNESLQPSALNAESDQRALEDVKVLDFMWVMAGPAVTRVLADYGATIVRVESTSSIDTARGLAPFQNGEAGPESSALFMNLNAGKLGLTLDMTKEKGLGVVRDLVRWADVVTESFSPKAMRAWGLDYDSLRQLKPDLVMLSSCLMGQTGPLSMLAGFGTMGAAIAGFNSVIGWPDREPAMVGAYTDYVSPRFAIASILAALDHRDRTGQGQYIDFSQSEASLHFLTPALLDYAVNGHVQGRAGNRDPHMAPHGVYPAAGDDRWVAVAVANDGQWRSLCEVLGRSELASEDRFTTAEARLANQDELDGIISEWTRQRDMYEVQETLQSRGVPAHALQNSMEAMRDPQLLHRGHFVQVPHEIHGSTTVEGSRFSLSRTPARIEKPGPTFGRDNQYVLEKILGYDEEKIVDLVAGGVLE
ncbi:MAG: CoA transferase [Chloroflexi bacterium]|nr:CoA transferase [Chloroflexota bacterium]